jgi:ElaB/YqjD/DUF883 family membrane-anchored ribosome-binding protein
VSPGPDGPDQTRSATTGGTTPNDPDAIKAEIEATREQLGRTVDELSHRLDVPERAKEGAYRARDTAVETYRENPPAVIGAGAGGAALLGLLVWRRLTKDRRIARRRVKRQAKQEAKVAAAQRAAAEKAARKSARRNAKAAQKRARAATKTAAARRTAAAERAAAARRTAAKRTAKKAQQARRSVRRTK